MTTRLVWLRHNAHVFQVETDLAGHVNIRQIAVELDLNPDTVKLNGLLRSFHGEGFTFAAVEGGDSEEDAIAVTGRPAAGVSPFETLQHR